MLDACAAHAHLQRVIPIDLRWGLTAEDTSDSGLGALEHCLIEIDNRHASVACAIRLVTLRSRPFFLVLAGERYGWIPPGFAVVFPGTHHTCTLCAAYRVSDDPAFQWVKTFPANHSVGN